MRNNNAGTGRITCAVLLLALTAGLSGCGSAVEEYTVIGATNEVSQVTSEPFSSIYPTLEYAKIGPYCKSVNTFLVTGNEYNIKEIEAM
jgi:hypothetical protein